MIAESSQKLMKYKIEFWNLLLKPLIRTSFKNLCSYGHIASWIWRNINEFKNCIWTIQAARFNQCGTDSGCMSLIYFSVLNWKAYAIKSLLDASAKFKFYATNLISSVRILLLFGSSSWSKNKWKSSLIISFTDFFKLVY